MTSMIKVNDVFDMVYVINLDREIFKYKILKKN